LIAIYAFLADIVLLLHLVFVLFVALGGFLVWRWRALAWLHLPAVFWGVFVELAGAMCPLTPLEVVWRERAGEAGYSGGFLEHYVTALLYPEGLTRELQIALGTLVLAINVAAYSILLRRVRTRSSTSDRRAPGDCDIAMLARAHSPFRRLADAIVRLGLIVAYRLLLADWAVRRPRGHGVYVLAWWQDRLLLVRHAYKPKLFVPGGSPRRGEAFLAAAARELREEVGVTVEPGALRRVGQLLNRHEYKYDVVEIFEVELNREPELEIDGREIVWAGFRAASELPKLDLSPLTQDFLRELRPDGPPESPQRSTHDAIVAL
jgi:ADP-ribose pyrophosphatase YjhB (NUDIX family)